MKKVEICGNFGPIHLKIHLLSLNVNRKKKTASSYWELTGIISFHSHNNPMSVDIMIPIYG